MSLSSRCNHCGANYLLLRKELSIATGWVRCAHCGEVFNAAQNLVANGSADAGSEADHRSTHVGAKATPPADDSAVMRPLTEADRRARQEEWLPGSVAFEGDPLQSLVRQEGALSHVLVSVNEATGPALYAVVLRAVNCEGGVWRYRVEAGVLDQNNPIREDNLKRVLKRAGSWGKDRPHRFTMKWPPPEAQVLESTAGTGRSDGPEEIPPTEAPGACLDSAPQRAVAGGEPTKVTTVAQLATYLNRPAAALLEQLESAGVPKKSASEMLTETDKERLLQFLKRTKAVPTVLVRKRVFVKRDDVEPAVTKAPATRLDPALQGDFTGGEPIGEGVQRKAAEVERRREVLDESVEESRSIAVNTVAQFAAQGYFTASELMEKLRAAGVVKRSPDDVLTDSDKKRLHEFLRSEIKQADASGTARTIQVDVRKKRVFVKRDDVEPAVTKAPTTVAQSSGDADRTKVDTAAVDLGATAEQGALLCHQGDFEYRNGRLGRSYASYLKALRSICEPVGLELREAHGIKSRRRLALGALAGMTVLDALMSTLQRFPMSPGSAIDGLRDELRTVLGRLGRVTMALGRPERAVRFFLEAANVDRDGLKRGRPDVLQTKSSLARALRGLASAQQALGNEIEAKVWLAEALELECVVLEQRSTSASRQALQDLAERREELTEHCLALKNFEAALHSGAKHVDVRRALFERSPREPRLIRGLIRARHQFGAAHIGLDQRAEALREFEACAALAKRVIDIEGRRSPAVLRDLSDVQLRFGELLGELKGPEAARARYLECVELRREARKNTKRQIARATLDLCTSLDRLAETEELLGHYDEARSCYEEQQRLADELVKAPGAGREDWHALGLALQRLGQLQLRLAGTGDERDKAYGLNAAYRLLGEAANAARRTLRQFGKCAESSRRLTIALVGLGNVAAAQGWHESALDHYQEAWQGARASAEREPTSVVALKDLRECLGLLGNTELKRDASASRETARAHFAEQVKVARFVRELEGATSPNLRHLAVSLARLGKVELLLGHQAEAVETTREAVEALLGVNAQMASWPADARMISEQMARLVFGGWLDASAAFGQRARLWDAVARFVDLNKPEIVDRSRADVLGFHTAWLGLALAHAPEQLPAVLAGMQGRKLINLAISESKGSRTRRQHRLSELGYELRLLELGFGRPSAGRDSSRSQTFEALKAEHQRLESELAADDVIDEAALRQIDMARLQQALPADHALILVVQRPAGPDNPSAGGASALVVRSRTHSPLIDLPRLSEAVQLVRCAATNGQRMRGQRYSLWPTEASAPSAAQDAAAEPNLADDFWALLSAHLAGTRAVHVVTHGDLHLLPTGLGAPRNLRVYQYPALIFFFFQHGGWTGGLQGARPGADDGGARALAAQVYSPAAGEGPPPIPFVNVELDVAKSLWSPVYDPLPLEQETRVAVVHLAGHGQAGGGQEACLLLGPNQRLGLHELLGSRLRPEVVYLSACLVGRTSDDLDGDPLGMVSGFFLRGARCVVAPLVPVSDFHAPLLAILFHHALNARSLHRRGLDAWGALAQAKEQLRSGVWPREVIARVQEHYVGVVEAEIGRALAQSHFEFELQSLLETWLLLACSVPEIQGPGGPFMTARSAGARAAADIVVKLLVKSKVRALHANPGVAGLLRYMTVFGAPAG